MRNIIMVMAICLLSCSSESKRNNEMEQLVKSYATDSLNIQNIIGEEMFYFKNSYKIKNGKLIIGGMRDKERTSNNYTSLIFVIDMESKKLLSTIEDPIKDYVGMRYDMVDDSTLFITHILTKEKFFLINLFNKSVREGKIQFDESANSPGNIDANGKQLFMTSNVYGFAVADLNTLKGKVFVNSNFSTLQSTVSYPIDKNLNLLSGTFKYDSSYRESITIYAIGDESQVKWEKALPFIKYEDGDKFYFYNYEKYFIVKYHNAVECLDKEMGKSIWTFADEYPIIETYRVGNKLVVHSFFDSLKMVPSDDEKWNKKMQEGYRNQLKIIDLNTGNVIWNWSKNHSSSYPHLGILGNDIFVYNDKNAFILNLDKMQEQPIEDKIYPNEIFLKNIMDTKTGKLYLEHKGTLYW